MEAEERVEPEAAPEPHTPVAAPLAEASSPAINDGGEPAEGAEPAEPAEGGEGEPAEPAGEPAEGAEPAEGSSEEGELFVCVKRAQARAGVGMDSEKWGSVEVDEVVTVLEAVDVKDGEVGITRLRTARGYVSLRTRAGNTLFELADSEAVAAAALRRAAALEASSSDEEDGASGGSGGDGGESCCSCCCGLLRNLLRALTHRPPLRALGFPRSSAPPL